MTSTTSAEPTMDAPTNARVFRVLGEQVLERPTRERVDAVGVWATKWRSDSSSLTAEFDAALARIENGARTEEEELRKAFTHLFRGISELEGLKPPYESLYRDGQLYGQTAREVQEGYRHAGFEVATDDRNELPDHLGIELEFLGELTTMTDGNGVLSPDRAADAIWWLLDDHLTQWLPVYRSRLHDHDPPDYYGGLLDLTLAVVDRYHESLSGTRKKG